MDHLLSEINHVNINHYTNEHVDLCSSISGLQPKKLVILSNYLLTFSCT